MSETGLPEQVGRFIRQASVEKTMTARIRPRVLPDEDVFFWWSHVPANFHPDRSLREY